MSPHTATQRIMAKPAEYFGCQWLLGHDLYAIVRIRFAIRTYGSTTSKVRF